MTPAKLTRTKGSFYDLRYHFAKLERAHGLGPAMHKAWKVYTANHTEAPRALMPVESLKTMWGAIPFGMYRFAVSSAKYTYVNEDFTDCMAYTIAALMTGEALPKALDTIVPTGPDMGHPIWHLLNPFYHLWRDAALAPKSAAQDHWRENPAIAATAPVLSEDEYAAWAKAPDMERDRLGQFVVDHSISSLIDMGCGNGRLLRYAVDNFRGCQFFTGVDLHANRASAAIKLIERSRRRDYVAGAERCDLLSSGLLPSAELAILNRVAGCFNDAQLRIVLGKIADSGARWIFEAEVLDTWDLWQGRRDPSELYASAGWKLHWRELLGDPLTPPEARYMVLPNKYWCARAVRIWEQDKQAAA